MRISRVKTSSFAIDEGLEARFESKKKNPRFKLHKRYAPLARFRLVKAKGLEKGLIFKKKKTKIRKNRIYVDLSGGGICTASLPGVVQKKPQIQKLDIYRRVKTLTPTLISILNYIWERGSVQTQGLDKDAIIELSRRGLVSVYEPKDSQIMNLLRIITDDNQIMQYKVKPTFYLPREGSSQYDLSRYLETVETADEEYVKDPIRQSIKNIIDTLGYLYNCELVLEEITYLPYLLEEKKDSEDAETIISYPLGLKGKSKPKRGYASEVKLSPISLSTELYEGESVPVEKKTIGFSDIGGLYNAKREITEAIIYPFIKPELSKKFGQKGGGGILLYGPPGCGKTQLARAAVTECGVSFFNVNTSDVMNQSRGEAKRLHEIFERAADNAPAIIFFDEIDALCSRKSSGAEDQKKVLNQFLMDMSGVEQVSEGVLVIGATNVPWELDPALRRAGRFTKQIYVPPPDHQARLEILRIETQGRPIQGDVNFQRLAEETEGYSGADISEVCKLAARIPWKNAVSGGKERGISADDFRSALREQKSSLLSWAISAEKEIRSAGEENIYPGILETVKIIRNRFSCPGKEDQTEEIKKKLAELDRKELKSLLSEKKDLEEKIRSTPGGEALKELRDRLSQVDERINSLRCTLT